jgi:hypothetical protein
MEVDVMLTGESRVMFSVSVMVSGFSVGRCQVSV